MTDTERTEKAIEKLNEIGKIVAFLKTDDETYSAGEDLDKIQQDLIRFFSALLQQPPCQPSAEFVKETREWVESFKYNWPIKNMSWPKKLLKACNIITAQAKTITAQAESLRQTRIRLAECRRLSQGHKKRELENAEQCNKYSEQIDKLQVQNTEQGIRLDTVNRIGKEACEELDQLQNENTEQAEEIKRLKGTCICMDCGKIIRTVDQSKHNKECEK